MAEWRLRAGGDRSFQPGRAREERAQRRRTPTFCIKMAAPATSQQRPPPSWPSLPARQGHEADHVVEGQIADHDGERDHAQRAQCWPSDPYVWATEPARGHQTRVSAR